MNKMDPKLDTSQFIQENLRYLLWKRKVNRKDWAANIVLWAKCDIRRAEALLEDANPVFSELEQIAMAVNLSQDCLLHTRLITEDRVNVLATNLRYILDKVEHGARKKLAGKLKIHPTTISRWCNGVYPPSDRNLCLLSKHLGLPISVSLENDPLFLSDELFSEIELREELHHIIDTADIAVLRQIYRKLLETEEDVLTATKELSRFITPVILERLSYKISRAMLSAEDTALME